jgi:hypothetical protein
VQRGAPSPPLCWGLSRSPKAPGYHSTDGKPCLLIGMLYELSALGLLVSITCLSQYCHTVTLTTLATQKKPVQADYYAAYCCARCVSALACSVRCRYWRRLLLMQAQTQQ